MTQQHQGQVIISEVIRQSGRSQAAWARDLNVSAVHLNNVIHGRKRYSPAFAVMFEKLSGGTSTAVSAEELMRLQADYLVSLARVDQPNGDGS